VSALERIWPMDRQGRLVNRATTGPIPEDLLELCHDMTDLALQRFEDRLHSVYLTGDAAWDWPAPARFRIVLRDDSLRRPDLDFGGLQALQVRAGHVLSHPVEVRVHGWSEVREMISAPTRLQMRLATSSRCIAGPDLTREIIPPEPDRLAARALVADYTTLIERIAAQAPRIVNEARLRRLSRQAAHRTLETLFALIMDKEGVYTECPEVMAGFAAMHWPQRRHSIATCERVARDGVSLSLELSSFIDHHTAWVRGEVSRRLSSVG